VEYHTVLDLVLMDEAIFMYMPKYTPNILSLHLVFCRLKKLDKMRQKQQGMMIVKACCGGIYVIVSYSLMYFDALISIGSTHMTPTPFSSYM
jgi:hypothetical protein